MEKELIGKKLERKFFYGKMMSIQRFLNMGLRS